MDALAATLARSPELFPHNWDLQTDTVTLVRLTRADYEAASFLDERALKPHTLARGLPYGQLAEAVSAGGLAEHGDVIFHIGHVGSTLLSRLLGTDGRLFALREPAVLRTLARLEIDPALLPRTWREAEFDDRLTVFLKLLSRTFEPGQTALIKATSFVSELGPQWLARPSQPKAILLFVRPETYMATILAAPNARAEAKTLTEERLRRFNRHAGREIWRASALNEWQALAAAWATEMSALVQAKRAGGVRALPLDFDRFLETPDETLAAAFRHFDCDVSADAVAQILAGPHMQRYSKAPEHAYTPELRREILDETRKAHASEIEKALAWLDRQADTLPILQECLHMAGV